MKNDEFRNLQDNIAHLFWDAFQAEEAHRKETNDSKDEMAKTIRDQKIVIERIRRSFEKLAIKHAILRYRSKRINGVLKSIKDVIIHCKVDNINKSMPHKLREQKLRERDEDYYD